MKQPLIAHPPPVQALLDQQRRTRRDADYEAFKRQLYRLNLDHMEFQQAMKAAAERIGV